MRRSAAPWSRACFSALVVPLIARNQPTGVCCFFSGRCLTFDAAFLRSLEGTGRHLGELGLRSSPEKAVEAKRPR